MDKKMVSVIMANHNTPIQYLEEAIDSILCQTYSNFEFIIIDDASTDGSLTYIENLEDDRIVLVKNKDNIGLTKSLNKGLQLAKGEYVARMDSDDIAVSTRLEKQVQFMQKNKDVVVCGSWFEKFGDFSEIRRPIINDFESYRCQLLFSNTPITLCHPSAMMRMSVLKEHMVMYDEALIKAQDYGMWVECSKYGRIAIIDEVLLKYRTHPTQISVRKVSEQTYCGDLVCQKQLEQLGIDFSEEVSRWRHAQVQDVDDFEKYYNWLKEILAQNSKKNAYSQKRLEQQIEDMQWKAVKRLKEQYGVLGLLLKGNGNIYKIVLKKVTRE